MSAPDSPTSMQASVSGINLSDPKVHIPLACTSCTRKKIRCDRKSPCGNCKDKSIECIASTPAPPRPRRKKQAADLRTRLRQYEILLRGHGVDLNDLPGVQTENHLENPPRSTLLAGPPAITSRASNPSGQENYDIPYPGRASTPSGQRSHDSPYPGQSGRLIYQPGRSRFLDNNLWAGLEGEFQPSNEILDESSEGESSPQHDLSSMTTPDVGGMVLLTSSPSTVLTSFHPEPVRIFQLWQAFTDNVNPLLKVIHAPSVQQVIGNASGKLNKVPRSTEALMFAIYASAINSLSETDCMDIMEEPKARSVSRYLSLAEKAIHRAQILKSSDIQVLQALTLFLATAHQQYDTRSLWVLSGVAIRIGQRIGLHRDGASMGLPPFEVEMRRRLWWQIVILDARFAQLSGSGSSVLASLFDTKLPTNVNDSDLNIEMRKSPTDNLGTTEMLFCLIRYEVGVFLLNSTTSTAFDGSWQKLSSSNIPVDVKDTAINELERILENKYIQYCDPMVPLHFLTIGLARSIIAKSRLIAHHPRQFPGGIASMTVAERESLFLNSLQLVEFDNIANITPGLDKYRWHVSAHFQLDAFIYMLSELCRQPSGNLVNRAWVLISCVYDNHPDLITVKNPLYAAVGNLVLRAWEEKHKDPNDPHTRGFPPAIINLISLRKHHKGSFSTTYSTPPQQDNPPVGVASPGHVPVPDVNYPMDPIQDSIFENTRYDPMTLFETLPSDLLPVDWTYWDDVLQEMTLPGLPGM